MISSGMIIHVGFQSASFVKKVSLEHAASCYYTEH